MVFIVFVNDESLHTVLNRSMAYCYW